MSFIHTLLQQQLYRDMQLAVMDQNWASHAFRRANPHVNDNDIKTDWVDGKPVCREMTSEEKRDREAARWYEENDQSPGCNCEDY